MAFADEVKIVVKAGKGGDGLISFRRERYVPRGGPDGGDGGKGGSVYLIADHNETNLSKFLRTRHITAENGQNGKNNQSAGKSATDLVISVPVGTQVIKQKVSTKGKVEEYLLTDLDKAGTKYLLAKGGGGGAGNMHFARPSFQAPKFADLGEAGEELEIILRLKIIAEVGLIGLPNAGKSTLLSVISNAKPKIADYAFTTLIPNLGLVDFEGKRFLVADIPGLVEGAHTGKGLGISFLKHIERTKVLVHLVDALSPSIKEDFKVINNELKKYNKNLAKKPQIIAINKIDAIDEAALKVIKKQKFGKYPIFYISAAAHTGLTELLHATSKAIQMAPKLVGKAKVFTLADVPTNRFEVTKKGKGFVVKGDKVEKLLAKTDIENQQAMGRAYSVLKRMGVLAELKKIGAKDEDKVTIGTKIIEYRVA
ncbi:GTPase ObgE [Patescibacteria group bacterium]|nr:GTPase ObgE [Patescibacteria group bacterium]